MARSWKVLIEARTSWDTGQSAQDELLDEVLNHLLYDRRIMGPASSYDMQSNDLELLCDIEGDIAEVVGPAVEALQEAAHVAGHADSAGDLGIARIEVWPAHT